MDVYYALFHKLLFIECCTHLFVLPHGKQQNDVQHDYLIEDIKPDLPDQHDDKHYDRTPVEGQQVDHTHQFLALLAEPDADILRYIIPITGMQAAEHSLQGRGSFHL